MSARFFSSRRRLVVPAIVVLLLGVVASLWWTGHRAPPESRTLVGRALGQADRPIAIVIGDYYLFGDVSARGTAPRLVWDQSVPTREDLTIVQMLDPARANNFIDYNQQFVSGATIQALSIVRGTLAADAALRSKPVRLVAASQMTPELLKCCDIIYVGQISGMAALLRDPLAQASGFRIEPGFGGLVDRASARPYRSDGMVLTDERIARRDYAYVASFPGPAGNRIMVIAGLGEAGVKQAAQLAGDNVEARRVNGSATGLRSGFEALYRVRTIQNVNVGATAVLTRPLRVGAIWDDAGTVAPYRPIDGRVPASAAP